jgi:Tol biopolymer transport system component
LGGIRGQLHVIAPEPIPSTASQSGTGTRIPAGEEVIAFFWSPDGSKLAFFKPLPSTGRDQRIVMTLFVYDTERREVRNYGTFPAASTFAYQVLPHFDQYQRSATIWSPDSSQLVLSGMEDRETPAIYVVDLAGGEPVKVAEGHMAFWRPGVEDDVKVSYSSKTMWSDSTPR